MFSCCIFTCFYKIHEFTITVSRKFINKLNHFLDLMDIQLICISLSKWTTTPIFIILGYEKRLNKIYFSLKDSGSSLAISNKCSALVVASNWEDAVFISFKKKQLLNFFKLLVVGSSFRENFDVEFDCTVPVDRTTFQLRLYVFLAVEVKMTCFHRYKSIWKHIQ